MSRTLRVVISRELLEDFEQAPPNRQEGLTAALTKALQKRLAGFNPEHDAGIDESPPEEVWQITGKVFGH